MLNRFIVNALTDTLTRLEATIEQAGWDGPPILAGLFSIPATDALVIETDPCPIEPQAWYLPGAHPAAALDTISRHVATQDVRPRLAGWLRPGKRRLLSFAFVVEGWRTTPYDGYQRGDLNQVPAMADAEVRTLTAIDTDLRLYQLVRVRGGDKPSITVHDQAPPLIRQTTLGDALLRLVHLARSLQAGTTNGHRH